MIVQGMNAVRKPVQRLDPVISEVRYYSIVSVLYSANYRFHLVFTLQSSMNPRGWGRRTSLGSPKDCVILFPCSSAARPSDGR